MLAQLVMVGAGQLVIHKLIHDLESFFYILVGICVLLDGPYKPKCNKDLVQCFDKYFNTFEPSVLKMITIQSDLTWKPLILQHISTYFEPLIDLLTSLCNAIIVPLSTDDYSNVSCNKSFTHNMFIANIIQTLSHLNTDAWTPVDQVNNNDPNSNLKAEVKEELAGVATEEPLPPINTANQLSDEFTLPVMASTLPPMLPRPTSHQPFAGPGFYSVDSGLALCHTRNQAGEELYCDFPHKCWCSSSRGATSAYHASSSLTHGTSNYVLHEWRGRSTGSIPRLSVL